MPRSAATSLWSALSIAIVGVGCGGGDANAPPPASVATTIAPASATNQTGTVGEPVGEPPSVVIRDQRGDPMAGVTVVFAAVDDFGTVSGEAVATNSSGIATVGSWTLSTTAGMNIVLATVGPSLGVTFNATGVAGAPATVEKVPHTDGQTATVNTSVASPPTVLVKDQHGNRAAGVAVTFVITVGGGSIGAGAATTDASGFATVGSWTLGALGENALTATVAGVSGPTTFTATGIEPSPVVVAAIAPATLTPGATMTITGAGFSPTPTQNVVTIDGIPGTVTAASATELNVVLPANFTCEPERNVAVSVTVAGDAGTKQHPLRVATPQTLAVGAGVVLASAEEARCNELANIGGRYFITVYNTNRAYSPTGAPFELRGGVPGSLSDPVGATANSAVAPVAPSRTGLGRSGLEDAGARAHHRVLEENIQFLRRNRHLVPTGREGTGAVLNIVPGTASTVMVGDIVPIRLPKAWESGFCANHLEINTRVAYAGTRSVVLEDVNDPLAGKIDSTYASIGQEFDDTMFPILEQNFGNPLAMDAALSNTGKVHMVFSKVLNDNFPGIAGFVVSCDFFTRQQAASSNVGQYFYAVSPTAAGDISLDGSPPRWRWTMRSTIIHEAKHITSFAERLARAAPGSVFEESWLEESTARLSEELYERVRYGFAQRSNIGYGSAANPVGPYCGVRLSCNQPRGFRRSFEDLHLNFYTNSPSRSPIGRLNADDFSFYSTGWSLVRWSLDHAAGAEATLLKSLTQTATLAGLANLEANAGRQFADMLPEWLLSMALDDRAGITVSNARVNFPSWNIPDVFAGLNTDFQNTFTTPFPLATWQVSYGDFMITSAVVPATGVFAELSGTQSSKQLLELRSGPGVAAPAELRMAIVRIQ